MLTPDRVIESELLRRIPAGTFLAGVDEVGRGAIAGPVSVGIALVGPATSDDFPAGLRDSKLLSARAREELVAPVSDWVVAHAVGHASPADVDRAGIIGALRIAAGNALAELAEYSIGGVLLDGSHDWWSSDGLFETHPAMPVLPALPVQMQVKGDARCAVIASASVLAKVARDQLMVTFAEQYPHYELDRNKGYASAHHIAALREHGVCDLHRTSWNLPGIDATTTNASDTTVATNASDSNTSGSREK